ncbi:MAG: 3'(2'),5'-bisphosphate nucleotidase [Phycisphaerales bacterium]
MSHDIHLSAALGAVGDACRVARAIQQDLGRVREITKEDRSPVTVADFAVQAIVAMAIHETGEVANIVGEEHTGELRRDEHAAVLEAVVAAVHTYRPDVSADEVLDAIDTCNHDASANAYWALDPIDGTKGFLRGQQYAIALARIENGRVVLGVMGCPNLPADFSRPLDEPDTHGTIYGAVHQGGAWELPADDPSAQRNPIAATTEPIGDGLRVCESVEKAHSQRSDAARIVEVFGGPAQPVRLDSQCKYAVVARGQADAYLRMPTSRTYVEKIWDHAAGSIIATEAGAVVTDITGAALDFTHGRQLETNRGIVCAAPHVHGRIIKAIDRLGIGATV